MSQKYWCVNVINTSKTREVHKQVGQGVRRGGLFFVLHASVAEYFPMWWFPVSESFGLTILPNPPILIWGFRVFKTRFPNSRIYKIRITNFDIPRLTSRNLDTWTFRKWKRGEVAGETNFELYIGDVRIRKGCESMKSQGSSRTS